MSKSSGIGLWYGHGESDRAVLEDLLKDCRWGEYDWDVTTEDLASGEIDTPVSVIAQLPTTLADARPSNPWSGYFDADGNWVP